MQSFKTTNRKQYRLVLICLFLISVSFFNFFDFTGVTKNDAFSCPLSSSDDDSIDFQYLEEAKHIFDEWKQSGLSGLTSETFLACTQTIGAIPELVKYLNAQHQIECVLPGKLLSDPIEGRFDWYRQIIGGNFYVSVKQILLAEKRFVV